MNLGKDTYANGQKIYILEGNNLTYYFKDGTIKAKGTFDNNMMQGEWLFYRATGQLWQIAHFKDDQKDGHWIRYDKAGNIEYEATFQNGKALSKK